VQLSSRGPVAAHRLDLDVDRGVDTGPDRHRGAVRLAAGQDLYRLDADALGELDPDLILTQDLCAVCAVDVGTVDAALAHLGCRAQVLTLDPGTLSEVLASILTVGQHTGQAAEAGLLKPDDHVASGIVDPIQDAVGDAEDSAR